MFVDTILWGKYFSKNVWGFKGQYESIWGLGIKCTLLEKNFFVQKFLLLTFWKVFDFRAALVVVCRGICASKFGKWKRVLDQICLFQISVLLHFKMWLLLALIGVFFQKVFLETIFFLHEFLKSRIMWWMPFKILKVPFSAACRGNMRA